MKKIFSLFVAMTAVVCLSAKTVYLNTAYANWSDANAVTFIHAWGGEVTTTNVQMLPVEQGSSILSAVCDDNNTSIVFVRMAPGSAAIDWDNNWGKTGDQNIPADKNQFTVVGWNGEPSLAYGIWGTYGVLPTVALVGDYAEDMWGANATNTMTPAADNGTASVTLHLTADTYEIKVWVDGYYMSLNGENDTKYRIHRDWDHADFINLVNDGKNFEFVADVTGDYTFTWNYVGYGLAVLFPVAAGIENHQSPITNRKLLKDGQLLIEKNGVRYNAFGAELK